MILHRHQMRERIAHLLAKFTAQEKPGTEAPPSNLKLLKSRTLMNQKGSESSSAPPVGPPARGGASVQEWLHWLEAIHPPTEIDLGLDRVLVVLRRLFPRKPQARIITVAGTNGKGTTVTALESILLAAGRSTGGAYMSPPICFAITSGFGLVARKFPMRPGDRLRAGGGGSPRGGDSDLF